MSEERALSVVNQRQKELKSLVESDKFKKQLGEVAGKFITPEKLVRLTLLATSRQPQLLDCTPDSILRCMMDAALLKIEPGGVMGRGYLVPRYNGKTKRLEAVFDPGWRGLVDIARRSGQIQSISAHPVYLNDTFKAQFGTEEAIIHEPCLDADPGPIIAAYAIAKFKDGSQQVEVLSKRDLDKIRATSMSKGGPWANWEDEMARKSAVRRLCKYLPFSDELDAAVDMADKATSAVDFTVDTSAVEVDEKANKEAAAQLVEARTVSLKEQVAAAKRAEESAVERQPGDDHE